MDDIRARTRRCGSERDAAMGELEGGLLAMIFAAAKLERTSR